MTTCNACSSNPAISGGLCGRCESEQMRLGSLDYPAHAQHSDNPRPDSGKRHDQRVRDTRKHLSELPDLYAQLGLFTLPGSTPPDPDQRSGKSNPSHRCVLNLDVLDLTDARLKDDAEVTRTDYDLDRRAGARRQGIVQTLASWSRLVDEERRSEDLETDLCEDPTITSETGYLLAHGVWVAAQPWFDELHDDVQRMWADVRRVIGERDPITYECPTCGWDVQPRYDGTVYACSGCERNWTMANEIDALVAAQASAMTLGECALEVGRPVKTLHEWKSRGWIMPLGKDRRRGQFVFDVRLVQRVAETVRNGKRMEVA